MQVFMSIVLPVGLTYFISWSLIALYYWLGGRTSSNFFPLFGVVVMWVPGVVGLIFSRKEKVLLQLFKRPDKFYIGASLTALLIITVVNFLSIPFTGINLFDLNIHSFLLLLIAAFIFGLSINMFAALGEEIFWRGYLLEKLKRHGIIKMSFLIGLIWGVWHIPLILIGYNYPYTPLWGIILMPLLTIAISPLLFYFKIKGKAIMFPAAFHGTMNAAAGISQLVYINSSPLILGSTGLIGIIVFMLSSFFCLYTSSFKKREWLKAYELSLYRK